MGVLATTVDASSFCRALVWALVLEDAFYTQFNIKSDHSQHYDPMQPVKKHQKYIVMALIVTARLLSPAKQVARHECGVILHIFLHVIGLYSKRSKMASAVTIRFWHCSIVPTR